MQPPISHIALPESSPSFNSYSSETLADIAARVVRELDDGDSQQQHEQEEFEFAILPKEPEAPPISADDIFYNGQILPIYPIFNTALLLDDHDIISKPKSAKPLRLPLGKFFSQDRETTTSCSSSEADDLESLPADTYCVWNPKKTEDGRCKKSSSTGSNSKRWKFRDLLYRSNSDGKENYVLFSPAVKKIKEENDKDKVKGTRQNQKHYVKSRAGGDKDKDKRRSFLPYRPDLVGLFLPSS
ncbi:hypothetical protein M5689_017292 [Euphorbia peplus]|nr:hypothetical protein M5689_017292 [Euphorbia peplus]